MASITQIRYEKNKGFWIDIYDLEIICAYIVKAFEQKGIKDKPEWYIDLYENFDDFQKGHLQYMPSILLDTYIDNKTEREEEIIEILEITKTLVSNEGEKLSVDKLNDMQKVKDWEDTVVEWTGPLYTDDMLAVIDIMIQMLKHEWTESNYKVEFK